MSTQYKRTNFVQRLEDYSSCCSSGFRLGQCLIAGILAIFTGISRLLPVTWWLSVILSPSLRGVPSCAVPSGVAMRTSLGRWRLFVNWLFDSLTPDVPVVSTFGACSLKSPASVWRGVVFVALIAGSVLPATSFAATIQGIKFNDLTADGEQNHYVDSNGNCVLEPVFSFDTVSIRDLTNSVTTTATTTSQGEFSYESSGEKFRLWISLASRDWTRTKPTSTYVSVNPNDTGEPIIVNFGIRDTSVSLADACDPNASSSNNTSSLSNVSISSGTSKGFTPVVELENEKIAFEGKEISLQGNFSDTDENQTYTFVWDFGDGNTTNTQNVTHTYENEGQYTVTFTVKDSGEETGQATMLVKVFNNNVTLINGIPITEHDIVDVADYHYFDPIGQKIGPFKRIDNYLFVMNKQGKSVKLVNTFPLPDASNIVGFGSLYKFSDKEALKSATQELSLNMTNVEYISPLLTTERGELLLVTNQVMLKRPATINEASFKAAAITKGLEFVRKLRLTEDMYLFKVTGSYNDVATVFKAARDTSNLPQIDWAEPDFLVKPIRDYSPSEMSGPYDLWHLTKIDADATGGAWDDAKGENIVIAINDDGVQWNHPDLEANLWTNPLEIKNGADDDGNGYADDIHGWNFYHDNENSRPQVPGTSGDYHGTPVAGVAVAVGDNGNVVGSAMKAKILPIRVWDGDNFTSESLVVESIYYEAKYAHVANHSWGHSFSLSLKDAVKKAVNGDNTQSVRGSLGVPMVFSSGNGSSNTVSFPANIPEAIAVGASTDLDERSSYSNYGTALDVVAPSNGGTKGIATTDRTGTEGMGNGDYITDFGGTSSAAPLTAGVAAVLLSHNPTLTAKQVEECLKKGAVQIDATNNPYNGGDPDGIGSDRNNKYGYGRINMKATLEACADPCKVPNITSNGDGKWNEKVSNSSTFGQTVLIKHAVTDVESIEVANLCVSEGGKLLGKPGSVLDIIADNKIQNAGVIQAAHGFDSTASNRDGKNLELSARLDIINEPTGYIQAGKGFDDVNYTSSGNVRGGKGGDVIITIVESFGNVFNEGTIGPAPMEKRVYSVSASCAGSSNQYSQWEVIAPTQDDLLGGNGGIAKKWRPSPSTGAHGNAYAGNAGSINIKEAKTFINKGRISNGYGGSAYRYYCDDTAIAGTGGKMDISPSTLPDVTVLNLGELDGAGGEVWIEPITIELSGSNMRIHNSKKVVIFGGDNAVLKLNNLNPEAIVAEETITIAVGKDGVVDLTGNATNVFKAGQKVEIFADNVLLDDGVTLEEISESPNVEINPSKIIYHVVLSGQQQTKGQSNMTVPISLTVANSGPKVDTYTLSAVSDSGWNVSGLPSSITIEGLTRKQLDLSVVLPAEGNDTITIAATSQADPTVVATMKVQAIVDLPEVVELENVPPTAVLTITPETGEAPLTVALDGSASTDTDGTIASYAWTASDGQTAEGQNAQLTFNEAGDYTITLKVTDNDGAINSATKNVKVEASVNYAASGTIQDKFGNPIVGVTVQIGDKTVITDATGSWEINDLTEDEYTVIASKDGYLFDSKTCVVSDNVKVCQPAFKAEPVLDVKVVPEPRIANQGEDITYNITVTNQGEGTATGVILADVLPDNTNLVTIEALEGGSCQAETLTCSLPDLTPGATANVKVVISNNQAKTLLNTVTVTTQEYPTDVKKTRTQVIPYLSVTVTDQPDPIEMLQVLHYSVAVELSHYAPSDATGITLVSQLPKGVELKSITSDDGVCDSSAFPQITCQMTDLSVASADSISHASVEMEVALQDAGLLLLTHEAKVTATEYPAHLVRERTTVFIPEDIQVDLALVIDVTGSMQEEINGVIKALKDFMDEIDASPAPLMALLTFGDEVKVAAFTRDMDVLRGAIKDLTASGGGLCEEASIEALLVAIPHTKAAGDILFATDASPYDDADVDKVIELLRSKGIRFNAMITGDCSMPESWNNLP